jgi:hypothetical protein
LSIVVLRRGFKGLIEFSTGCNTRLEVERKGTLWLMKVWNPNVIGTDMPWLNSSSPALLPRWGLEVSDDSGNR